MKIQVLRYSDNGESTLGLLFVDGKFQCYTLEDEKRTKKVFGQTRVPEGTYDVIFRKEGSHHARYNTKFPEFHKGMLAIVNKPNWILENNGLSFKYILIHIGNNDDDTAGCLLVGNETNNNNNGLGYIKDSTGAYVQMYKKISAAIMKGDKVIITYTDFN